MITAHHPWEQRQAEKERQAAADTVERLTRALVELEAELEYRRQHLAEVLEARDLNRNRMVTAAESGAVVRFGMGPGSRSRAESGWPGAPSSAIGLLEATLRDAERFSVEEQQAHVAVTALEQQHARLRQGLAHWTLVRDGLLLTDRPNMRAPLGPTEPEVEQAKAAVAERTAPEPSSPPPPTSVSISARLAEFGRRMAGW